MNKNAELKYKDSALPVDERVEDLLSRMTIVEKVAQLMGQWSGGKEEYSDEFLSDPKKMKAEFGDGVNSVHSVFSDIKETLRVRNKIQKYLLEETRLGIPAIFVDEGQHGLMRFESTVFPQALGLASSWNPALLEEIYDVVANEMRSRGTHLALSPVIDVCREPRWGRVEETYGEDPFLNGKYAVAAVKGLQGSDSGQIDKNHVGATLKHLVGHGEPEGGQNQAPGNFPERILREFHMAPFKMAIENSKPLAVMPSYNEVDGIPSHVNKWLLKDVLRTEWDFKGLVVSDYYAVDHLFQKLFVAKDGKDAAKKAFNAGVEYEFPHSIYFKNLIELIDEGLVKMEDINNSVRRILKFKFELGLFENAYTDLDTAVQVSKKESHKELALKAAHESIVLLKNDSILPLSKDQYKSIAVIGPCGKDVYFGGYAGEPYEKVSILEGIKNKVGNNVEVNFAQGVKFTENADISHMNWKNDDIILASPEENYKLIEEAVEVAKKSELIILAIGENEQLCREAWANTHIGDNDTLDLICQQNELVDSIISLGKPVIVYLTNGRPLAINTIKEKAPAILEGWYMGQETGTAVADVLFGDVNPSGKLTITFPRSVGQLPMYYNHKPTAQYHDYISESITPLFHFGYGLSYTKFKYSSPKLDNSNLKIGDETKISVEVTNSGAVKGDEIVQLYIRDKVSSVTRPVKELKGFERVSLNPGETKKVEFKIGFEELAFWNINLKYEVEPGEFEIMVGSSSRDEDLQSVTLKVQE